MTNRLYTGTLQHARYTPKRHRFAYKVFMPFVELDSLPQFIKQLPFGLSVAGPLRDLCAVISLGDQSVPLAEAVRQRIFEETGQQQTGPIYLLANWRYFGYQNNPIAVYYCYDPTGSNWNTS